MRFLPSHTVSAPSVHITYPPSSLWKFPPPSLPESLPPVSDWSYLTPINIDPVTYNKVLSVWYPIIAASLYIIVVAFWSQANQKRGHKPWAFSRTRIFYIMVLLHNILLAIYSAWTFVGMTSAIVRSWPGLRSADGLPGVVDALCKINGPRGLGNAVSFNSTTSSWGVANKLIQLLDDSPDNTDVGRIWNEGLAFYGWLFYLSKFYEVVDTLIILTKGKKTSVLQTYHHAGAMFSMWAGIRYMAPPIWLFVVANSFVHSLMVGSKKYLRSDPC
jgi:fatty-acid desaturase